MDKIALPLRKAPQSGRFSIGHPLVMLASACLGLSWLMPLHFPPWVSWHSELLSFIAIFLLAASGILFTLKKDRASVITLPVTVAPFGILVGVALIQVIIGQIIFAGNFLVIGLYAALCVMSTVLGYAAVGSYKSRSVHAESALRTSTLVMAATIILAGGIISAIISLVQAFNVWETASWVVRMSSARRPGGNMGQPNHLATLLLMGLVSLVFLYEVGRLKSFSTALIFLLLSLGLAASESRTSLLSFLVLSAWWFLKRPQINFKFPPLIVGLAGIVIFSLFWLWPSFVVAVHMMSSGVGVNTNVGTRLIVWPQLIEAVSMRPWWGWGLGEISKAHNAVAHAYAVSEPFTYSHNVLLDLMLGMGVPLTVLLVMLTCVWIWRRVKGVGDTLSWYCFAVAVPVAVHAMLEFPFAYAYFLAPVMFMLGALERMQGGKPLLQLGIRPVASLVLALSAVGTWIIVEYVAIEEDFRVARFEVMRVGQIPPDHQRPNVILLTQLDALLKGARLTPRPGMTTEELNLAKKVALRYPWTATQNRYALSLALNGNTDEALRQLRVIRALHGEEDYQRIKTNWNAWAQNKYPQLLELSLP